MADAEAHRSRAINARIRDIKELLRRSFAEVANSFERSLSRITVAIGELDGKLEVGLMQRVYLINTSPSRNSLS